MTNVIEEKELEIKKSTDTKESEHEEIDLFSEDFESDMYEEEVERTDEPLEKEEVQPIQKTPPTETKVEEKVTTENKKQERRLTVVTEGGIHAVEYLNNRGIYPNTVIIDSKKLNNSIPYLTANDDVYLIIKGLTDFNMLDIYGIMREIEGVEEKGFNIYVLSNVPLGNVKLPYYEYTGDLLDGQVKRVLNGKDIFLNEKCEPITKETSKKDKVSAKTNVIARQMLVYNNPRVKIDIHGVDDTEETKTLKQMEDDSIASKIINVDRFKNKNRV